MREIKFRGKLKEHFGNKDGNVVIQKGTWIEGGIAFDEDRTWIDTKYYGQILVDKETVGQYTGLKDKNGKEIYEGDIFKIKYNKKDFMVWVEYSEKYAQFITRCEENILNDEPLGDLNEKHIEVIGNIYDNPELIKED